MKVHYHCRHCAADIGTIEQELTDEQLGIHILSEAERQEMVAYDQAGNVHIKAICEICQQAFEQNPDLHQYGFLIQ